MLLRRLTRHCQTVQITRVGVVGNFQILLIGWLESREGVFWEVWYTSGILPVWESRQQIAVCYHIDLINSKNFKVGIYNLKS